MATPGVVRFGTFELDCETAELRNNGKRVVLQDQPARVLCELVRQPGRLVSREELRLAVWGQDTFIEFDSALNVAINKIRQALRDSAISPRFVETVPRRGYRFLADVQAVEASAAPAAGVTAPVPTRPARVRWLGWGAALLLSVSVAALLQGDRAARPADAPRSVAVLPFRPVVADARDEALEVGMAEAVIIKLGQVKDLRVPSIYAVRHYASSDVDPLVAGRKLDVETVLDGNLLRVDEKLRVSARLLDVQKGTTLWAHQWDLPWTDVFSVQDAMAEEVVRALAPRLAAGELASLRRDPTNVAAYDRYLRGRHLISRSSIADSRRAAELLEEAVRLDPQSAPAYASLAFAYISIPLWEGPTTPYVELGRQAAKRALELDPLDAEAHSVLGRISFAFDWDAEAGERELRRGLALNPRNPFVLHCYAVFLAQRGRFEEALAVNQRLLDQDPASVMANRDRALILYAGRRYDECVQQCFKTLELDPHHGNVYTWLGQSYEQLGRDEEALAAFLTPLTFFEQNQERVEALRAAARRAGLKGYWQQWIEHALARPVVPKGVVAMAYVKTGDHDRALAWLEQVRAERGARMQSLGLPEWDPLRADPRFQRLLAQANLVAPVVPAPAGPRKPGGQ